MMDREKIIEAVEDAFNYVREDYFGVDDKEEEEEWETLKQEAIRLLKEHETAEPKFGIDAGGNVYKCGACGAVIYHILPKCPAEYAKEYAKFCRKCGKAVRWND